MNLETNLCCLIHPKVECITCDWKICIECIGMFNIPKAMSVHRQEASGCPEVGKMTPGYLYLKFHNYT